jgi:hypothetical protein
MCSSTADKFMPRNVATQWNLTYDVLSFSIKYRKPIQILTTDWQVQLRQYEPVPKEWSLSSQLCELPRVRLLLSETCHSKESSLSVTLVVQENAYYIRDLPCFIGSTVYIENCDQSRKRPSGEPVFIDKVSVNEGASCTPSTSFRSTTRSQRCLVTQKSGSDTCGYFWYRNRRGAEET